MYLAYILSHVTVVANTRDFRWFDHNWRFSIPPPFVNSTANEVTPSVWLGLDNAAWGSHVYYSGHQ